MMLLDQTDKLQTVKQCTLQNADRWSQTATKAKKTELTKVNSTLAYKA
jgi:hypothetical protein